MEELIEVNLTRREIAMLVDVMGTTGFKHCDAVTEEVSDQVFEKLEKTAKDHAIKHFGWNIGYYASTDGLRFIVDPGYTIRNV